MMCKIPSSSGAALSAAAFQFQTVKHARCLSKDVAHNAGKSTVRPNK